MCGSLRILSPKLKAINRESRCSSNIHTLSKPHTPSLILPFKNINVRISALEHKIKYLVSPISSLTSPEKQTNVENEGLWIEGIDQSKTVRVKFQLKKECSFGQRFFIVGDGAMIGSWNPLQALQLNWSDGHVWSVELDAPIGRSIKFKFVLKGNTEEDIWWQPGLDRILQTWETSNIICVSEDWDNADLQKLMEEEEEDVSCNKFDTSIAAILEQKCSQPKESRAANMNDLGNEQNKGRIQPVLVPGLTIATIDDEQESNNVFVKNFGDHEATRAKEDQAFDAAGVQSLKKVDDTTYLRETTETLVADKEEPSEKNMPENTMLNNETAEQNTVPINDGVLENDSQWGRQTLQKLLSNFGIL